MSTIKVAIADDELMARKRIVRLLEAMPGVELAQEGRARVNNAVGYEVGYERNTSSERFLGRDVLLVPDDPEEGRGGVLLSLRQRKDSGEKLTPRERNLAYVARKAYRSFRFGTARG